MRKHTERIGRCAARTALTSVALALIAAAPMLAEGASPKSTTFSVSLTVQADCTITASALSFGTTGLITGNIDQTTTMNLTCSSGTAYNVALDQGSVANSTVATRLLAGTGSNTVNFALYRDSARTQNWGQTVGSDTISGTGSGLSQTLTVYGRVPAQTAPAAGAYSSTITATVTF
jgi:spore coat protein U-like protein